MDEERKKEILSKEIKNFTYGVNIFNNRSEAITHFTKLGYKIKEGPNWIIVIPKQKELDEYNEQSYYRNNDEKTCIICGSIFVHGQNHHIFCNCHRIFIECAFSKKYFEKDLDFCSRTSKNSIIDAILNNNKIEAYIRKFKQYGMWEKEEYIEKKFTTC